MSNVMRRLVAILGIIVGFVIIVIGINCVNTYIWTDTVGRHLQFGADFYTEMYGVTREVGGAINDNTRGLSKVCEAIGWLIVSIGAIDVVCFLYLLCTPKQKAFKRVFCANQDKPCGSQEQSSQPNVSQVQPDTYTETV